MLRRQKNFGTAMLREYTVVKNRLSNGVPIWHSPAR